MLIPELVDHPNMFFFARLKLIRGAAKPLQWWESVDRGGRADEMMVTDASKLQSSTEHTLGSVCVYIRLWLVMKWWWQMRHEDGLPSVERVNRRPTASAWEHYRIRFHTKRSNLRHLVTDNSAPTTSTRHHRQPHQQGIISGQMLFLERIGK